MHVCAQCERQFAAPSRLAAHAARVHDRLKPHGCRSCPRVFSVKANRDRHERTQHRGMHRLRCATCGKGYEDPRWLAAHVQTHSKHVTVAVPSRALVAAELQCCKEELCALRQQAALAAQAGCTAYECQVRARDRSNQTIVFTCGLCEALRHWGCAGYPPALAALPTVLCPTCLQHEGLSTATCELALFHRQLLEAHVSAQGQQIAEVPADGWCLVQSVANAVSRDRHELLETALMLLVSKLPSLPLDDVMREAVQCDCNALLQAGRRRQMHRRWDSPLGDLLPQVLADVVQRPLHILQAADCDVRVVVNSPAISSGEAPILLVRSYSELGVDHYDLVI